MTISARRPGLPASLRTAAAAALAAGLIALPGVHPSAHADATDDTFLAALRSKGIKFGSAEKAVIAAHEVCDELDNGKSPAQVASTIESNSGLDDYHSGFFVGASIRAFCPKYAS